MKNELVPKPKTTFLNSKRQLVPKCQVVPMAPMALLDFELVPKCQPPFRVGTNGTKSFFGVIHTTKPNETEGAQNLKS
jgi:hypothetical protein